MPKYTPQKQIPRTLAEYLKAHKHLTTHFVNTKLALAAQALVDKGMSKNQVARALDLSKDTDVWYLLTFVKKGKDA